MDEYNDTIDKYIDQLPMWQQSIMRHLRQWIHEAAPDVQEDSKWGAPYFSVNRHGLAWIFSAKDWVHFGFRQGALLSQSELFVPTANKAQRAIHFRNQPDMHQAQVQALIVQAVAIARAGKKVNLQPTKPGSQHFDLPDIYHQLLSQHHLIEAYKKRPYYQQKGWIQWIDEAKQETTKDKRRRAMLDQLSDGTYMPTNK
jgi:hypothetical protein